MILKELFFLQFSYEALPNLESGTNADLYGERKISNSELLSFPNPSPSRTYEVSIELPEFTCKCPFSGYPDFANIKLTYQPGKKVLELKALKLYINSFRDVKISHEEVANLILENLVSECSPKWMHLQADFNPRGNVHTVISVTHGIKK